MKNKGKSRRKKTFIDKFLLSIDLNENPESGTHSPLMLGFMSACTLVMIYMMLVLAYPNLLPSGVRTANASVHTIVAAEGATTVDYAETVQIPEPSSTEAILASGPVEDFGMTEYVHTMYVKSEEGLNVRTLPSTDASIDRVLTYGDQINTVEKNDEWFKLDNGYYVWANSVSMEKPAEMVSLGTFKITAYCTCHKCCHPYDPECTGKPSRTSTGTTPTERRTIAVDPRVIPLGSKVRIDGKDYIAEDMGGAIKGNRIDVFINSHSRALKFGTRKCEVYLYK